MIEQFSPDILGASPELSSRAGRQEAAQAAAAMDLPSTETEDWRYSPIGELSLEDLRPAVTARQGSELTERVDAAVAPDSRAATITVVDGFVVDVVVSEGWSSKGLGIEFDDQRAASPGDSEPTIFDRLHSAFSPGAAVINVADGLVVDQPIVIINHHASADVIGFPHIVVAGGTDSELSIVEWQTSADGRAASVPVVEIDVAAAGRVNYLTVQTTNTDFWTLARQRSSVGSQATLTTGIAAFGGRYARTHTDSRLAGRGSSANLMTAYYGDGNQIHDFRTFQHHDARDTRSDLLFKGAQDDASGSVYTGMIHIHPDGAGSNAVQTNRNIKLSEEAWAWSVPNLEIENNDVRCAHASTVSPVDDDQRFYLGARGVPPGPADRLIVAGFFNEVIDRMPVAAVRPELKRLIAAKLDHREVG